ncbi:MAG: hypothetical protein EOO77_24785 [Oxalobacteraceae bacterium]|nr:MAG: hypothetical protein EOO77_24785 [Oxalobacteraceae bacterium]
MIAALFLRLQRAGVSVPEAAQASLATTLLTRESPGNAWAYYAHMRPGVARDRLRDPQFAHPIAAPMPFDWMVADDNGLVGTIEGGAFNFTAPSSVGGVMLRQEEMLPPGPYLLTGHSTDLDQPESALPYWLLTCRGGQEVGRVTVPASKQANGRFAGVLRVPPSCSVQTLSLVARPSDTVGGLSGRIDWVKLDRPH